MFQDRSVPNFLIISDEVEIGVNTLELQTFAIA